MRSLLGALNVWGHLSNIKTGYDFYYSFKAAGDTGEGIRYDFTEAIGFVAYTIHYGNMTGAANGNPQEFSIESPAAVRLLLSPVKNGYIFGGWYDNADFTGAPVTQIDAGSDIIASGVTELTFYAKWTVKTYTVKFNTAGGSAAPGEQHVNFGNCAEAVSNPSRRGYTFSGWFAEGSNIPWKFDTMTVRGDVVLTAQWEKRPSNVGLWVMGSLSVLMAGGIAFILLRNKRKSSKAE